jgi:hypothetical protein
MSRASDVRDAIALDLQSQFEGETVEKFMIPDFTREELALQRRIGVRVGSRAIEIDQGVDERQVVIEVAVIGVVAEKSGTTDAAYRSQTMAACDAFDSLMESIIAKWTPDGMFRHKAMADHRFVSLEQAVQFDVQKLYSEGLWLSLIRLTYQDCLDEGE